MNKLILRRPNIELRLFTSRYWFRWWHHKYCGVYALVLFRIGIRIDLYPAHEEQ